MARYRQASDMIAACRRNTDNRDSQSWITDLEILAILNEELAELHARMTAAEGQPHFRSQYSLTSTVGQSLYALPADFYRMQEINAFIDSAWLNMRPFMPAERADLLNTNFYNSRTSPPMYRLAADNIEILPVSRIFNVQMFYLRACPLLVNLTDVTDGFDGYETAAVYGASATMREMEQMDASYFSAKKTEIFKRIDAQAALRDQSSPERVQDISGDLSNGFSPWWLL